jgi:putative nucleotidyltransferase with HDIG domain
VSVSEGWTRPLRTYLPQSIVATFAVVAAPLLVLWISTSIVHFDIPAPAIALMALSLTLVTAGVASEIWDRRPGAREISFSELLLWSWYRLQKADERLAESHRRITEVDSSPEEQLRVLQELSDALETKDPYTRGHSSRVARHSFNIACALGLSLKEIEVLRKAASLHDVGKMRVPNRVLHKAGKLDDDERAMIEEHPVLGAWMVASIGDEQIVRTVRHHHERWDGTGYPDRIGGNDIPLFSRIIAVADTYDAITSTRSYRAGGSRKRALSIIRAESGSQFDPLVVEAFLTTLPARTPIVAGLALLTGPQFVWKQLVRWFQRFGSGAIAPGLGAVGAVVVLGASTFVAPGAIERTPAGRNQVPISAATAQEGGAAPLTYDADPDEVLGIRISKKAQAKKEEARASREDKRGERSGAGSASRSKASRPAGGSSGDSEPVSVASAPAKPADRPQAASAPAAPAAPPIPNEAADALDDIDDPKAGKGSDCAAGLGKASKGSRLHCN